MAAVVAYPLAACVVAGVMWPVINPSLRSPAYFAQVALCVAAGPVNAFVDVVTVEDVVRQSVVGAGCMVAWVAIILLAPALRRASPLVHLVMAVAWTVCGALMLVNSG